MTDLPRRWTRVQFGDLLAVQYGKSLSLNMRSNSGAVPVIGSSGTMARTAKSLINGPVIVVGRKGNVGTVQYFELGCWPIDTTFYFTAPAGIDARFLQYQLGHVNLKRYDSSTATPSLRREDLESVQLVVPPYEEQLRIVAALEFCLSRLNAGLAGVATARRRIGKLEQSILNRGVSGQSNGRTWPIMSLGQLSHDNSYGTSVKCSYSGQGVPVVRIPNVVDGGVDLTDIKYANDPTVDLSSAYLSAGDVLFVRTNGSRSLIGRTAVVDKVASDIAFASYLIRFRLRTEIVRPGWIHRVLDSPAWRRRLEREAASSAGQYNLSLAKLQRIPIPLPGLGEQDSILKELTNQCSANDRLKSSFEIVAARGEALHRSLLNAAFSGRLVQQDTHDERASVLLERIKVERAAQPKVRRARRTPNNPNDEQGSLL